MQKLLLLVAAGLLLATETISQDAAIEKKLDSLLSKNFKPKEPGVAVLVARKGKIIYQEAYGSANLELDVPLQPDMVFRIGSITKSFTSLGILQLVEQGKISLQDSLQKFIPGFPAKGITIEHLLTHTSGIKDYMTIDHPDPYIERHDLSPAYIIDHFKNAPLEFEPGTRYNYTNSGYVLLGYIIEKVTAKSYHQYIKENIIDRAGMKNTSYASERNIVPKRVTGYTRDEGYFENTYYQSTSLGFAAGDLLSTMPDLYAWNRALRENKLVKKELLEKAFTPHRLPNGEYTNYGYGFLLDTLYGRKCIWHAGQVNGFIALEMYFPKDDVFFSLATNVKSGEDKTEFSNNRFALFFQLPFVAFNNKVDGEISLPEKVIDQYTGNYDLNGRQVRLFKQNGMLHIEFGAHYALHPVSETRFFLPTLKTSTWVDFVKDRDGKVVKMLVWQNRIYEWKKTE
jgi:CubicO group peptidase (beta-lactamase class C family)